MSEIFDIVDADDCVIDRAERTLAHAQRLRHRAAHVLVFDPAGRLFLQQRAWTKDCSPGLWDSSVGGHLESGEGYLACAEREMMEELGVAPSRPLEFLCKLDADEETGHEFVCVYRARGVAAVHPDPGEIVAGGWFESEDLARWLARAPEEFTGTFRRIWTRLQRATGAPAVTPRAR